MLISITFFIPKRRRKKGMVRMKRVSDICEMDNKMFGFFTAKESGYFEVKSARNCPPNAFVICSAAPRNMEKIKKIAILVFLNNTKASSPGEEARLFFSPVF